MTDIQHDFSSDWCATPELGAQNDHPPASNYCNLAIILAKAWFSHVHGLLVGLLGGHRGLDSLGSLLASRVLEGGAARVDRRTLPERDELLLLLLLEKVPLHECTAILQCRPKRTNTHNTYTHST